MQRFLRFDKSKLILASILVISIIGLSKLQTKVYAESDNTYSIQQLENSGQYIYKFGTNFAVKYLTQTFDFTPIENKLTLRISETNEFYGDIEQIKLDACGAVIPIDYAKYLDSNEDVKADLEQDDLNVVVAGGKTIEISWNIPDSCTTNSTTLSIKANQYKSPETNFYRFPERGHGNEKYIYKNSGSITVDGNITEVDGKKAADFSPMVYFNTGHPINKAYLYFNDDINNLYLSVDMTGDNSNEFGPDWIELTAYNTPSGIAKKFRITDNDNTYGQCGFGITTRVSYKHETCEFVIPKTELNSTNIEFSMQYYGTGGVDMTPAVITITQRPDDVTTDNIFIVRGSVTDDSPISYVHLGLTNTNDIYTLINATCSADDGSFDSTTEDFTCEFAGPFDPGVYRGGYSGAWFDIFAGGSTYYGDWQTVLLDPAWTTPGQPTNLVKGIVSGEPQANVIFSWNNPDNDGGVYIEGYKIQIKYADDDWDTLVQEIDTASADTAIQNISLARGHTYDLRVAAYNAVGVGQYSEASNFTIPLILVHHIIDCSFNYAEDNLGLFGITEYNSTDNFILDNDIDCADAPTFPLTFDDSDIFSGVFDGQNHEIRNFAYTAPDSNYGGLFKQLADNTQITNLKLVGNGTCLIEGNYNTAVGAIAGYASGKILIDNVTSSVGVCIIHGSNINENVGGLIGHYSGNGLVISNSSVSGPLEHDSEASSVGGLVDVLDCENDGSNVCASISNSTVTSNIIGTDSIGGFVGLYRGSGGLNITQSHYSGSITQASNYIGGLIGYIQSTGGYSDTVNISRSYTTGTITSGSNTGGLIGVVGGNGSTNVTNTYSAMDINAYMNAGGLIGDNNNVSTQITYSYASGDIHVSSRNAGGLVGRVELNGLSIMHSFSAGQISANIQYAGGLIGNYSDSQPYLFNNFFDQTRSAVNKCYGGGVSGAIDGCTPINQDGETPNYFFNNHTNAPLDQWGFDTIWYTKQHNFPILSEPLPFDAPTNLQAVTSVTSGNKYIDLTWTAPLHTGDSSLTDYYVDIKRHQDSWDDETIYTDEEGIDTHWTIGPLAFYNTTYDIRLKAVNASDESPYSTEIQYTTPDTPTYYIKNCTTSTDENDLGLLGITNLGSQGHYVLANTINCAAEEFQPIVFSDGNGGFKGIFDGQNNEIQNLNYNGNNYESVGLFSSLEDGASIKDLVLNNTDGYNLTMAQYGYIGALAGDANGNVIIEHVTSNLNLAATYSNVGGLIGSYYNYNGGSLRITNSASNGNLVSSAPASAGGLVDYVDCEESSANKCLTITDSHFSGNIDGAGGTGGLIGYYYDEATTGLDITNSYYNGDYIHSNDYSIGGLIGEVEIGYDMANINLNNCYSTGTISGHGYVGGLVGNYIDYNGAAIVINNSHSTADISGESDFVGGLIGYFYTETNSQPAVASSITNSYSTGNIENYYDGVGGLVGEMSGDNGIALFNISTSYSTGDISGQNLIGGLVGSMSYGTYNIQNSYSQSYVQGTEDIGGLVGYMSGNDDEALASIDKSYASGEVYASGYSVGGLVGYIYSYSSITNSFSTGQVTGDDDYGALIGTIDDLPILENNYFDQYSSDLSQCIAGYDTIEGCTAVNTEGETPNYFFNNAVNPPLNAWSFGHVWYTQANDYPILRMQLNDTTPPVITLLGQSSLTLLHGATYTDAGATAQDNVDGDLTADIIVTGTVNTDTVGTYEIDFNVCDFVGNCADTVTRVVNVQNPATPTPTATSTPKPTVKVIHIVLPTETPIVTITNEVTATPTETLVPTISTLPLTGQNEVIILHILGPNGETLANTQVVIDGTNYTTDKSGNLTINKLSTGSHSVSITIDGKMYTQSFVLGATDFQQGKEIRIESNQISILPYVIIGVMLIGAVLIVIFQKQKGNVK